MTPERRLMVPLFFLAAESRATGEAVTRERVYAELPSFAGDLMSDVDAEITLARLADSGLIVVEAETIAFTPEGWKAAHKAMLEFGFAEGSRLEAASATERRLRERMEEAGFITITDEAQRAFVAEAVRAAAGPVLDVGCGDGRITARLAHASGNEFMGLDSSRERIEAARLAFPGIPFHHGTMEDPTVFTPAFGSAVLIDSLYFTANQTDVLSQLLERISSDGVIVLLYGVHAGPGMEESALALESLPFYNFLKRPEVQWEMRDFSNAEHAIWKLRLDAAEELRDSYCAARESYLYWSNVTECRALEKITAAGRNARRACVISRRE